MSDATVRARNAADLAATYDRIADDWLRDHLNDEWSVGSAERFVSLLGGSPSVLDVGCGPGIKAAAMAKAGAKVTGIDFSSGMIAAAGRHCPAAEFRVLDAFQAERLGRTFDGVFAQAVLLHIPKSDAAHFLACQKKVTRPGGLVYVAVKERREGQPEEQIVSESDYGYEYRRFFSYFTEPEIRGLLAAAGLESVDWRITPSGKTRWIECVAKHGRPVSGIA